MINTWFQHDHYWVLTWYIPTDCIILIQTISNLTALPTLDRLTALPTLDRLTVQDDADESNRYRWNFLLKTQGKIKFFIFRNNKKDF